MFASFAALPLPVTISLGTLAAAVLILVALVIHLNVRIRRLASGKNGASLEESIAALHNGLREHASRIKTLAAHAAHTDQRVRDAARGVATVRFDAMAGTGSGGRQSFATALISENGDGVVLSSMHAREHTRIYAKPIAHFASDLELTDEERAALDRARERISAR